MAFMSSIVVLGSLGGNYVRITRWREAIQTTKEDLGGLPFHWSMPHRLALHSDVMIGK